MNHSDNNLKTISEFQIHADEMAYTLINEREKYKRGVFYHSINDLFEFNTIVFKSIVPLLVRYDLLLLIAKSKDDLKTKITISQMLNISKMYNLVVRFFEVENIKQIPELYKKIKGAAKK